MKIYTLSFALSILMLICSINLDAQSIKQKRNARPNAAWIKSFDQGKSDYCMAGATSTDYEFISNVSISNLNHSSGSDGYSDYTDQVAVAYTSGSEMITVTNGDPLSSNQCGIWVDWNRDGDFYDTNETISVSGTPGAGPYTADIDPPAGTSTGACTMRIRITWNSAPDPCGITDYGEVEDYTLYVTSTGTNVWTGGESISWGNPANWSLGHVPDETEDVAIPAEAPNTATVDIDFNYQCLNFLMEPQSKLDVEYKLMVLNESQVYGSIELFEDGFFNQAGGDFVLKNGASVTSASYGNTYLIIWEDITLESGSIVENVGLNLLGSGPSILRNYSAYCYLRVLSIGKNDETVFFSAASTQDIHIYKRFSITDINGGVPKFISYADQDIIIEGHEYTGFNNYGGLLQLNGGALVLNIQSDEYQSFQSGDFVNNLVINSNHPSPRFVEGALEIKGDLTVSGTELEIVDPISLHGNLNNNLDNPEELLINEINFIGDETQWANSFNCNTLVMNKPSAMLTIPEGTVVCDVYDWTSGGINVGSGTFTALDLADDGIFGGYNVYEDGVINLTNDGFVDLRGDVHVFGGTFNVTGSISWWPYNNDASLMMTSGLIDFKNCSITIKDNAYDLNVNITGGKIKTVGNFINERPDADLSQVDLELYGNGTHSLELAGNQALLYLEINKTDTDFNSKIKPSDRNGNPLPESGKSTQINLTSEVTVSEMKIFNGSFYLNGHEMTVDHDFTVFAGGAFYMDNPADVLNVAETAYDKFTLKSGSETVLSDGIVNLGGWIRPMFGCSFTATIDNMISLLLPVGAYYGAGLSNHEPSATYGNVVVDSDNKRKFLDGDATQPIVISGDLTINPENMLETQNNSLIVHGNIVDFPSSTIRVYKMITKGNSQNGFINHSGKNSNSKPLRAGNIELDNFLEINGTLDIGDGSVLAHDFFEVAGTGSMLIDGGSFICDVPYQEVKAWSNIHGNFEITEGLFEVTYNSPRFSPSSTSTISGGIIRSGGGFMAEAGANFNPTGGTLEMTGHTENPNLFCYSGTSLFNLHINCPEGHTVHYLTHPTVQNDLTIDGGNLESGYYDYDDFELYIGRDWTDNSGGFIPNNGTVIFYGYKLSQITTDATFYNLTIDKTNSAWDAVNLNPGLVCNVHNDFATLDGAINLDDNTTLDVDGNVFISDETGLNAWGNVGIEIFVGGSWTNENTIWDTGIGYSPGTEIITFDGSDDQILTTASVREDFGNLVINKPSGEFKPSGTINVYGNFLIENGNWVDNTTGLTHYFVGEFEVSESGGFLSTGLSNTVVFKGTTDQNVTYNSGTGYFYNIIVDKTDWPEWPPKQVAHFSEAAVKTIPPNRKGRSQTVTLLSSLTMNFGDALTIDEGTLDLNGNEFRTWGDVIINEGGKLQVDENAILIMESDYTLSVNDGGEIEILGAPGSEATVTRSFDGYYGFEVNDGGSIRAEHAIFEYIGSDWYGLHMNQGAIIDPAYSFTNCTFQNGNPDISAGALLTLNNEETLTITGAHFPEATTDYNVAKDTDMGHYTFVDYTGDFSGEPFEWDPHNRIDWYEDELTVTPPEQVVGPGAGTTTFTVTSNVDWTVTDSVDWLTVDPMSGSNDGTLTVNFDENLSVTVRTGEITISGDGVDDVTVSVTQAPADPELTVTPPERNVSAAAGSTTFTVESNTNWWVTESVDWFTVDPASSSGNGTLTVNYEENLSTEPRSGEITLTSDDKVVVTVIVNQAGADPVLAVLPPKRNASAAAGLTTFDVTSNTEWGIMESVDWFTVDPMSGSGNGILTVDYDENLSTDPRSGEITVTTDEKLAVTVIVNQAGAGPVLAVLPPERNVSAAAGLTTFDVTSNTAWGVMESVDWLTVDPMSGSGNGILTVDYDENLSTDPRSGEITVTTDEKVAVTVVVNQAGQDQYLTISPDNAFKGPESGNTTFLIQSNIGWTISEAYEWLSVSPEFGSGDLLITVEYDENATGFERSANIEIDGDGGILSAMFTLTQESYPFYSIELPQGWSGISSYLMPANNDVEEMIAPIAPDFMILQNLEAMYYPGGPVNTLGTWDAQFAGKIKTSAATSLTICGPEETDKVYNMETGWNLVPVICNAPVGAADLFEATSAVIVKEVAGCKLLWPEYSINTLGDLIPGEAYLALLESPSWVTFPENLKHASQAEATIFDPPHNPWNANISGSATHSIAILASGLSGVMPGDVIGVFDANENCFGLTEIQSLSQNQHIVAFGDDVFTHEKAGFENDEEMNFKIYRPGTNEVFDTDVNYDPEKANQGNYQNNGVSVIKSFKAGTTGFGDHHISNISLSPNPTTGVVEISGLDGVDWIELFSMNGNTLKMIETDGQDKIRLDISDLPAGMYQVKLSGNIHPIMRKLIKR